MNVILSHFVRAVSRHKHACRDIIRKTEAAYSSAETKGSAFDALKLNRSLDSREQSTLHPQTWHEIVVSQMHYISYCISFSYSAAVSLVESSTSMCR